MKDKKHIDELFNERFKNFEASPSPEVWTNIQASLKKEKVDRKVVPLWLRWSGVAAILALLLLAGNFFFDPFGSNPSDGLTTDTTESKEASENPNTLEDNTSGKDTVIASEDDNDTTPSSEDTSDQNEDKAQQDKILNETNTSRDAVANQNTKEEKGLKNTRNPKQKDLHSKKDLVETYKDTRDATAVVVKDNNTSEIKEQKQLDAKRDTDVGITESNTDPKQNTEDIIKRDVDIIDSDTPVVTAVDTEADKSTETEDSKTEDPTAETDKPSLIDVVNEQNAEKAIAKNEAPDKRWEVAPTVGPVYYDSFGDGSSIDPTFSDNPQNSDINFSYGVAVSYHITDKFSVRSGINNVRLSYSTGGIELADAPVGIALKSVDYGGRQTVVTAFDRGTIAATPMEGPFGDISPKSGGGNPEINQRINYFEVPLEMRYALTNGRFGVNMIGGFSTLFLGSNEISVQDGSFRSTLGEANNLNSLSFSTNIGLGFDYKISRSLRFNLEPIFKYQLNPYSDSSVNFRPYYFGVYSGLSFKF